jgi:hypothetical protein
LVNIGLLSIKRIGAVARKSFFPINNCHCALTLATKDRLGKFSTARSLISKFPIYLNKIYILQWFQPFIGNGQLSYLLAILSTHQLFNRDRKFSKT